MSESPLRTGNPHINKQGLINPGSILHADPLSLVVFTMVLWWLHFNPLQFLCLFQPDQETCLNGTKEITNRKRRTFIGHRLSLVTTGEIEPHIA